jgi:hypothetical protein
VRQPSGCAVPGAQPLPTGRQNRRLQSTSAQTLGEEGPRQSAHSDASAPRAAAWGNAAQDTYGADCSPS